MKFAIVVDDGYGDSAAPVIAEALQKAGPVEHVKVSEFVASAGYYFMPSIGFLAYDPKRKTRDLSDTCVVNRVVEIGSVAVGALDGESSVLHPNVVLGTYSRIMGKAKKTLGPIQRFPACQVLPINMQWHCLRRAGVSVKTPAFAYGLSIADVDASALVNPIQKDPFDIYNWRDGAKEISRSNIFLVDRPAGRPLISYFAGAATSCFSLEPGRAISTEVRESLEVLTRDVAGALAAFMGECLLFEENGELTFAAYSRYLRTSTTDVEFASVVHRGLEEELNAA